MRYLVPVQRVEVREHEFEVEASSLRMACEKAEDAAHSFDFADGKFVNASYKGQLPTAILEEKPRAKRKG